MTSRNVEQFLNPLSHLHTFYYIGFITVVIQSLIPLSQGRDVIYERPLSLHISKWFEM